MFRAIMQFSKNSYISETTWNFPKRFEMQRVFFILKRAVKDLLCQFLCSAMDFFVFNPFQITLSFTPISYFGHSGYKRSFTALFNMKSTVYICKYLCGLHAQYSGKIIFDVFTLCISNRFGKFQVVSENCYISETTWNFLY